MYVFIVNPVAGHGRSKRIFSEIKKSKLYQQMESKKFHTEYTGHAEEIAFEIARDIPVNLKAIVVVGGDGTLHEVINGLGNGRIPLAFIPGGSGNDFARGSSTSGKPLEILNRIIEDNESIPYWLGHYKVNSERRFFVNSVGVGFDAEVARAANASSCKKLLNMLHIGSFSYVLALLKVLFQFNPFTVNIEIDGKTDEIHQCWMLTFANHPYYGGGMKIIPNAIIQPDIFPFLIIHNISKWKILGLFLTVFTGQHVRFTEVDLLEAKKVKITSDQPICFQVDGQTNTCRSLVITKDTQAIHIMGTKI